MFPAPPPPHTTPPAPRPDRLAPDLCVQPALTAGSRVRPRPWRRAAAQAPQPPRRPATRRPRRRRRRRRRRRWRRPAASRPLRPWPRRTRWTATPATRSPSGPPSPTTAPPGPRRHERPEQPRHRIASRAVHATGRLVNVTGFAGSWSQLAVYGVMSGRADSAPPCGPVAAAHAWYAARRGRGPNDGGRRWKRCSSGGSGRTRGPSVAVFVGVGSQVHGAGAQLVAGPQPGAARVAPLVGIPPDWAWPAEISVLLLRGPPWQDGAVFIRVNGSVLLDLG